jgi:mannose-binding lectin 1
MRLLWSLLALAAVGHADDGSYHYEAPHYDTPHFEQPHYDPDFTFGHKLPISSDRISIPGFRITGHSAIIHSERVDLTLPEFKFAQRAGIFTERPIPYDDWSITVTFHVSGEDKHTGSLHFWYTSNGHEHDFGQGSVYTSPPWDGLALVIDSHIGKPNLRAYLNDGKTQYTKHHDPPSLAFASCEYNYRNKPHASKLTLSHSAKNKHLRVELDGVVCIDTDKVVLPKNNYFGITAATPDKPDSFSIHNIFLSSPEYHLPENQHMERTPDFHAYDDAYDRWNKEHNGEDHEADYYKTHEEQFSDLHDRLQALNHQVTSIQSEIGFIYDMVDTLVQHQESLPRDIRQIITQNNERTDTRLTDVENVLKQIQHAVLSKDYTQHFERLRNTLEDHHTNMLYSVPAQVLAAGSSKIGMMLFLVVLVQVGLAVSYMVYKRRRHNSPKKYL